MQTLRKRKKRWIRFAVFAALLTILMLLNGCTTVLNGDFCNVYQPIYPDYEKDTPETIRQIDVNNIVFLRFCE